MKKILLPIIALIITLCLPIVSVLAQDLYDFKVKTMDGKERSLAEYKGKVLLIVNTASQCGYTPQYKGLEAIYKQFKDKGFEVLAFPTNNFGEQEPGSNGEIKKFCELRYKTTFPVFSKIGWACKSIESPEVE